MQAAAAGRRGRAGTVAAIVFAIYLVLAGLYFAPAWSDPAHTTVGVGLDADNTVWFMRWVGYAVAHGRNPLLTTYMNYPHGVNVMWNNADALPLLGLVGAPFAGWVPMILVFNVFATLAFASSAWTAFLAIRRHVDSLAGAFLGGVAYGFGAYMTAQGGGHMGLTLAFIPPLMLISLESILVEQRRRALVDGALLGVLAAVQVVLTEEMLASEFLAGVILLGVLVAIARGQVRGRLRHAVVALSVAAVTAAVLSAYPLATQFFGPQHLAGALRDIRVFSTDLGNFIEPTQMLWLRPLGIQASGYTTNSTEADGFLGLPLLAIVLVAAVCWHRRADVRVALAVGLLIAVLSLGPRVHLHGQVIFHGIYPFGRVPLLENILPARLMLFADLAAGWLLAVFIAGLRRQRPAVMLAGWVLAAGAVLALFPSWPGATERHDVPVFLTTRAAGALDGKVALVIPAPIGKDLVSHEATDTILWQADAGMSFRVVNNSAIVANQDLPQALGPLVAIQDGHAPPPGLNPADLVADLKHHNIDIVVLGPMQYRSEERAFLDGLLGPGVERDGVVTWTVS